MTSLDKTIKSFCRNGKCVTITRRIPESHRIHGYTIACLKFWFIMQVYSDFVFDGYALLNVEDVASIRSGASDRHYDHMLRSEAILRDPAFAVSIQGKQLSESLRLLKHRRKYVIVESEWPENEFFYIGSI